MISIDRRLILLFALVISCFSAKAQSASEIVNRVLAAYRNSGGIEASYSVSSIQGSTSGKIAMQGDKFRILSNDLCCWYDGSSLWTYSSLTGEVDITIPTEEELLTTSPYIAITDLQEASTMSLRTSGSNYIVTFSLNGRNSLSLTKVVMTASSRYQILKAVFTLEHGESFTIDITNYVTGKNYKDSTFTFDKSLVPAGTEVIDLR